MNHNTGDLVRNLLAEADTIPPVGGDLDKVCAFHLPLERKITALGTALGFIGDGIDRLERRADSANGVNAAQSVSIAVLKSRSAMFGVIGGLVAAGLFELGLVFLPKWIGG